MFFDQLKKLCDREGISPTAITEKLGMSKGTVSNWRHGGTPNGEAIVRFSERFNVSTDYLLLGKESHSINSLSAGESEILKAAKSLDEVEKFKLAGAIPVIVAFQRNPTSNEPRPPLVFPTSSEFEVSVYDMPASAGTGLYLDSEDYTLMTFPADEVPQQSSFGVRLRGDSMTPDFEDGDIVFVKRQPELQPNEIGIFMLDGNAYCKKYIRNECGEVFLKSLNSQYDPIPINECSDLRVLGKVIGKIHGYF